MQKSPEHGKGHRVGSGQGAVDGRVPVAALRRRDHSLGGSLVLSLRHQLSRARGNDERAGRRRRPHDIVSWTQRYAPELEKRSAWYRSRVSFSWRVDETYVRVKGHWKYLYRAIDKDGATLDFFLADRRNAKSAKRFLSAALRRSRD
jgi:DDE domain